MEDFYNAVTRPARAKPAIETADMDEKDKQPIIDEWHRQFETLLKQQSTTADRILSYAKLRINANEKLTLLASGVLTFTFSGAISLYGRYDFHLAPETLRPLLWAWKLLIFAIVCCITANSREGRAASIHDSDLLASELWGRSFMLNIVTSKLSPDTPQKLQPQPKSTPQGGVHEMIAGIFGWAARVSTVAAFVLLYVFVRSLITQL